MGRLEDWPVKPHALVDSCNPNTLSLFSEVKPSLILKKLAYFIVQIYSPTWFEIKKSSKFHESPTILFACIQQIKQLPFEDAKVIALDNIQRNAFCLYPITLFMRW